MIIRISTCCNVCEISLLSPVSLSYTPSPRELTSKKGNANKSQINWKAKKKKSMRPLTPQRGGGIFDLFFGFLCFLVTAEPDCWLVSTNPPPSAREAVPGQHDPSWGGGVEEPVTCCVTWAVPGPGDWCVLKASRWWTDHRRSRRCVRWEQNNQFYPSFSSQTWTFGHGSSLSCHLN